MRGKIRKLKLKFFFLFAWKEKYKEVEDFSYIIIEGEIAKSLRVVLLKQESTRCDGYNLSSSKIFQKIVVASRNFSLHRIVLVCNFSETLQTIANGQNLYWSDLKHLLDSKIHVFIN